MPKGHEANNWFRVHPTGYEHKQAIYRTVIVRPNDLQEVPPDGTVVTMLSTVDDHRGSLVKISWKVQRTGYATTLYAWVDTRNLLPANERA